MKVAVISRVAHPLHGLGGFERHVGAMVRHLIRNGVDVTLYTSPPASPGWPAGRSIRFVFEGRKASRRCADPVRALPDRSLASTIRFRDRGPEHQLSGLERPCGPPHDGRDRRDP